MGTLQIILRPAIDHDLEFVNVLLRTTMHRYVELTWPNNPTAQQEYYEINRFDASTTQIIQHDGKDIGRLSTSVRADCIFIDELHIVPEYQGRGIGRQLISNILEDARRRHLAVKLAVLQANPAQNLYARMGFKTVAIKDYRLQMEYPPDTGQTFG